MQRLFAIAIVITLTSARARAETDDDTKSGATATWLSLGGTAAAYITTAELARVSDARPSARTFVIGVDVGLWLALPSLGHFYANDWHSTGLAIRATGIGAIMVGAVSDSSCENEPCAGSLLVGLGVLTLVTGTIYDIATASGAAHDYNRAHRVSIAPTVLNPPSGPVIGLGVGGQF